MEKNTADVYTKKSEPTVVEKNILESYDRLEKLQLEVEFLQACKRLSAYESQDNSQSDLESDIIVAQNKLLRAIASFQIRQNVTESVLIADPIICAIHAGTEISTEQQMLCDLLRKRDDLSLTLTKTSKEVGDAWNELYNVQFENMLVSRENTALTAKLLELVDMSKTITNQNMDIPKVRQEIDEMENAVRISRQKWKIMKGVASASIVGSGVDWARDPQLLRIVVDED